MEPHHPRGISQHHANATSPNDLTDIRGRDSPATTDSAGSTPLSRAIYDVHRRGLGVRRGWHGRTVTSGGSIIFLTTDIERIRRKLDQQEDSPTDTLAYIAIRIDHGEVVGRGPNPQELLALYLEPWQSLKG